MARVYFDKRTDWWCMDYRNAQGRRRQVKAGRTKILAEAMLRKIMDEVAQTKINGGKMIKTLSFDKFAGEYLSYSQAIKKFSSHRRDKVSIKNLTSAFSDKILNGITIKEIEKYRMERRIKRKPATVNRELACLKNMFTKAIQWGYASINPVRDVKLFKENNTIVRYLTPKEQQMLIACCNEHLRPIVITALNTGMRKSEILNLKWVNVDFTLKQISVLETKNNEIRYIPMNETLTEALESVKKYAYSPYVFCDDNRNHYGDIKKGFSSALKRAGITNFRFHDLRHTFASCMVMSGVDITTVSRLLGHKTLQMTLRYSHLSPAHQQNAVNRLDTFIRGVQPEGYATQKQHRTFAKVEAV